MRSAMNERNTSTREPPTSKCFLPAGNPAAGFSGEYNQRSFCFANPSSFSVPGAIFLNVDLVKVESVLHNYPSVRADLAEAAKHPIREERSPITVIAG